MAKILPTYSVSYFNLGGLEALFGKAKPTKTFPAATGVVRLFHLVVFCMLEMQPKFNIAHRNLKPHKIIRCGWMQMQTSCFKSGAANLFETASYFLCTD